MRRPVGISTGALDRAVDGFMRDHGGVPATLGYRAIAISGLAYATEQIPGNLADLPGVESIDNNANMILHGAYAGITFGW